MSNNRDRSDTDECDIAATRTRRSNTYGMRVATHVCHSNNLTSLTQHRTVSIEMHRHNERSHKHY